MRKLVQETVVPKMNLQWKPTDYLHDVKPHQWRPRPHHAIGKNWALRIEYAMSIVTLLTTFWLMCYAKTRWMRRLIAMSRGYLKLRKQPQVCPSSCSRKQVYVFDHNLCPRNSHWSNRPIHGFCNLLESPGRAANVEIICSSGKGISSSIYDAVKNLYQIKR